MCIHIQVIYVKSTLVCIQQYMLSVFNENFLLLCKYNYIKLKCSKDQQFFSN